MHLSVPVKSKAQPFFLESLTHNKTALQLTFALTHTLFPRIELWPTHFRK
jgi:hypothetical protein